MVPPTLPDIYQAIDATWPARRSIDLPGWNVREGAGGGSRVSSATCTTTAADIATMEAAHKSLGQTPLVMVRQDEEALDARLESAGYGIKDPVTIYVGDVRSLAVAPPPVTAFHVAWPPAEIQLEIWAGGDIGPARIAVMDRVECPKCSILGRAADQPAGTAFVAMHDRISMLHALEVAPGLRRQGMGVHIMRGAAIWAAEQGAEWMAVLVTNENTAANALYSSLGMSPAGQYHYRTRQIEKRCQL